MLPEYLTPSGMVDSLFSLLSLDEDDQRTLDTLQQVFSDTYVNLGPVYNGVAERIKGAFPRTSSQLQGVQQRANELLSRIDDFVEKGRDRVVALGKVALQKARDEYVKWCLILHVNYSGWAQGRMQRLRQSEE